MKEKLSGSSMQLLILAIAGILCLLTINMAKAQSSGANSNAQNALQGNNVITTKMPKKSFGTMLLQKTSLSYYHMFMGPTLGGPSDQTYNVFQEGVDNPNTGRAPLQSFQSALLRFDFTPDWGIGASLAMTNSYTDDVVNRGERGTVTNTSETQFFNARAHLYLPSLDLGFANLFSTFSYEAPTSEISKDDQMKFGLVLTENLSFKSPASTKWSGGVTGQIYRMFYENDQKAIPGCDPLDCIPTQLQTQIITISPYVNYRINDKWNWGNMFIMDWDQRGVQANSREFNNNLPHRIRTTLSYYPNMFKITNIGVFAQALAKYRPSTTAVGAEIAFRF